jgi:hypothetical protein
MEVILVALKPLIETFVGNNGTVLQVVSIIGALRILLKPTMSLAQAVVDVTPTQTDNEKLDKFLGSKTYATLVYVLDWFGSIKLRK